MDLNKKGQKLDSEIHVRSSEMQKALQLVGELELALGNVSNEKEVLNEMKQNGKRRIDDLIVEYQQCIFQEYLREDELNTLEEDMHMLSIKLDILESEREAAVKRAIQLLLGEKCQTVLPSEKLREELENVRKSIVEANSLLVAENSTDCQVVLSFSPDRILTHQKTEF